MMAFLLRLTSVLSLFLFRFPGAWVRGESPELESEKCCPGEGQHAVFHPDTGTVRCVGLLESEDAFPFPDCKAKAKLVRSNHVDSEPRTIPHCRGEFLVGDGENETVLEAFLFCPSDADSERANQTKILLQKCCPLDEEYDADLEKCISRRHDWTPTVFSSTKGEFRDLSRDEYRLRIDDLSSIPCTKHFLSFHAPGLVPWQGYPVVLDTGHLYVPALNSTFSHDQFCLDYGRFPSDKSEGNLARICHPTEKKIQECEGKSCVLKCCPESDYLLNLAGRWPRCSPAGKIWDPKRYFRSHPDLEDIRVITGFPVCPLRPILLGKLQLDIDPNPNHDFYFSGTGSLTTRVFGGVAIHFDVPRYCIDETRNIFGVMNHIACVCDPRLRMSTKTTGASFVLAPLSALFLVVAFLLILFSPERKSLPGKVRVVCVGSILLHSVCVCFRTDTFYFGVSIPLCLVANLVDAFWILSAFFWLNVMCFDLWRTLRVLQTPLLKEETKRLLVYSLYAIGSPAFLVAIACIQIFAGGVFPLRADSELVLMLHSRMCIPLDPPGGIWYNLVPVFFILVTNAIFFGLSRNSLIQRAKDTSHLTPTQKQLGTFWLYLKLFVVMGGTWLAGMVGYFIQEIPDPHFHTVLSGLQGVFIFFIFLWEQDAVKSLKSKWEESLASLLLARKIAKFASSSRTGNRVLQTSLLKEETKRLLVYSLYPFGSPAFLVAIACIHLFAGRVFPLRADSELTLMQNWDKIVRNLLADQVAPILISMNILDVEWKDTVDEPKTRQNKSEAILRLVRAKDDNGLRAFQEALRRVGQLHLLQNN
ncbi:unnamed protein product [Darwinula stevensoni]|uniref:Uncharacterized protein n=1 Tax=Darwinula stevensoni TaxID=69355 RepID=A0A7R9A209_9CRUS|nr:unnamed protein product [Darwinula stevensoni]CAG0888816.1 unnamed protein product [Darwinula stevensoni]